MRLWILLGLGACVQPGESSDGATEVVLWRHEAQSPELTESIAAIARFNTAQPRWRVRYETLPSGSYTESVTAAALAQQLPCILDVDQPVVPNFAWTGHLRSLDGLLPPSLTASVSRGGLGRFRGELYSVGQFDATLALYGLRSELAEEGIRVATSSTPYQAGEFLRILRRLKKVRPEQFPIDLNTRAKDEWLTYAYSPWLQSGGADLIDRSTFLDAEGVLNGPEAVRVVEWYQTLFEEGLTERSSVDEHGFTQRRAFFSYHGSWVAERYHERFGDDLVVMPFVDFGNGPRVGAGSWQWGISRSCDHVDGAVEFLRFLMSPREIARMSRATGLIPVTAAAAELTPDYRSEGRWRSFFEFARDLSVPRPATPGYPKISSAFGKVMLDVRHGTSVREALDEAVDAIEYDIARNRGYGFGRGEE